MALPLLFLGGTAAAAYFAKDKILPKSDPEIQYPAQDSLTADWLAKMTRIAEGNATYGMIEENNTTKYLLLAGAGIGAYFLFKGGK